MYIILFCTVTVYFPAVQKEARALKRRCIAGLLLTIPLLSACSLIPQEEILPQMPVVQEIEDVVLETALVMRGDLVEEKIFTCTYQPIGEEKLYFPENGQAIAAVYVQAGDEVKVGDLIAELDNTQIHQRIDAQQHTVDALNLQIVQEQNYIKVQKERIEVLKELAKIDSSYSAQIASAETALESRNSQITYLYAQLSVENSTLAELQADLKTRQLYAGIDGTVSYTVKLNNNTTTYTKNTLICTIQDLSKASFTGPFKEGLLALDQRLTLQTDEKTLEAVVSHISAPDEDNNCTVTFSLLTPDATLKAGDSARMTLVTTFVEDILYLPSIAVHKENDVSFVYYPDENGIIAVKAVETGASIRNRIQITGGLEEGDVVFIDSP